MPTVRLPEYSLTGEADQRYRFEVWVEKSTVNDVLMPLCERHRLNLVTGFGEMSIPAVRDLILCIAEGVGRRIKLDLWRQ